jgi:hypothetical protein
MQENDNIKKKRITTRKKRKKDIYEKIANDNKKRWLVIKKVHRVNQKIAAEETRKNF